MKHRVLFVALVSMSVALTACKKSAADDAAAPIPQATPAVATPVEAAPSAPAPTASVAAAPAAKFDIDSVPVSDKPLGAFPYFSLPDGYENPNHEKLIADLDRVPFWTGDHLEWVEGKLFQQGIQARDGKQYSRFELEKNLDYVITQAGGVLVTASKIPDAVTDTLEDSVKTGHTDGMGDIYNQPVRTYVLRRADRTVWVQICTTSSSANWMVAETAPFVPTAKLLPGANANQ